MLTDAIYRVGCKGNVLQHQNAAFLHFLFSSVSPAFSAIPSPSHSPFSVFPSFLIHFLCITPLLSTPIYSALPPPIFHKHTLYFSLLPSVTLIPSSPPSLSSSALWHFPLLLPFTPFIISLSHLRSRHLILSISFPPLSLLPIYFVILDTSHCLSALLSPPTPPFNLLFKAGHVICYLILSLLFYNTNAQMSTNVINNTGGQSVQTFSCLFWTHTWMHRQPADSQVWWGHKSHCYKLQYKVSEQWVEMPPHSFKIRLLWWCCLQSVPYKTKDMQEFVAVFHIKGSSFWLWDTACGNPFSLLWIKHKISYFGLQWPAI